MKGLLNLDRSMLNQKEVDPKYVIFFWVNRLLDLAIAIATAIPKRRLPKRRSAMAMAIAKDCNPKDGYNLKL